MKPRLSGTAPQIPSSGWIFANAPTTPKDRNSTHAVWTEVLSAEARLAPAVTGALCSAFDRLRDDVGPACSSERQHKVNDLRLPLWSWSEAQSLEQLQHRSVFGQHVRHQFLKPRLAGKVGQMTGQGRADAEPLIAIDDEKCHLGPSGLHDDVASTSGNCTPPVF